MPALRRLAPIITAIGPIVFLLHLTGCAGCAGLRVEEGDPMQEEDQPATTGAPSSATDDPSTATDDQSTGLPNSGSVLLQGVTVAGESSVSGQSVDVLVEGGRITAIGDLEAGDASVEDLSGRWLAPAFIDSHVHLSYLPRSEQMLDGGIAAAVDLAAPIQTLDDDNSPLTLLSSGPMVTAVQGYPTQSWGAFGYGLECSDSSSVREAVSTLIERGAQVIKMPITGSRSLGENSLRAGIEVAHEAGLKVASHAMSDEQAARAAQVGIDVLAHTPTGTLSEATLELWSDRAVIGTLRAFGGSDTAIANLRALREAGATVLYGTDFGNLQTTGIVRAELDLMSESGMSGAQILASGTSVPARWWGIEGLGSIEVGSRASLLVLAADPSEDPGVLADPEAVWIDGVKR